MVTAVRVKSFLQAHRPLWAILMMGLLYVLMPSINHSGDSFTYAWSIHAGEELFSPHHLLYNSFYYLLQRVFGVSDTLAFICLMNGLFAVGCLLFSNAILFKFVDGKTRAYLLIFLGSCFGFMRYATTGEAYIVPLFFSLCASWAALERRPAYVVALLAAIACLFHQVQVFWWIGLLWFVLVSDKEYRLKHFLQYGIVSCIVPVAYLLVFSLTTSDSSSIFEYLVHDYVYNEGVDFKVTARSLLLTPISFVRTFYQVHGYMLSLVQRFWIVGVALIASVVLGLMGCINLWHTRLSKDKNLFDRQFATCHLIIFILQLLFAFISDGNAEFMVMLPFALMFFLFARYRFERLAMWAFALSIFLWNLSAGLIPYHFLELTPRTGRGEIH